MPQNAPPPPPLPPMESLSTDSSLPRAPVKQLPRAEDPRDALLKSIQGGIKLKKVNLEESAKNEPPKIEESGTDALVKALQSAMKKREEKFRDSDSESEGSDVDDWDDDDDE